MNAQEQWRSWYRSAKTTWYVKDQCRYEMRKVRREAALERIIARQERTIAAQAQRIAELEQQRHTVFQVGLSDDV